MTPRERWLALLDGERPDRIPTDYWATDEVTDRLMRELECPALEDLFVKLHIDRIVKLLPPLLNPHPYGTPGTDIWGLRRKFMDYGSGVYDEFDNHPLEGARTVEEAHAYPWPSPENHDYEAFRAQILSAPRHRILECGEFEPFLLYCALRGMEQAFMDFYEQPEIVQAALDHIFEYTYALNQRAFEIGKGRIDMTYIAEDLGSQSGLLIGLPQIRQFILPNQKKMADLARSYGIHVFYHTDGAVRSVIPDLLATTGIEILNPVQWRCQSMDREGLVRDFGSKLIFHGAMDNQQTLPFGTVRDVENEVLENIKIFGRARWICAPCHNIQPVTPTRNIVAMYETIHAYGEL
jgi:uroporphyrinogen decarboxylase